MPRMQTVPDLTRLNDILDYKREALTQLLIVATIFGAFSISGAVALLASDVRGRLRSFLFSALSVASLAFIFATSLDAIVLPATHRSPSARSVREVQGLQDLGDVVIWAVMIGALSLIVSIGGFGFAFSRRIGWLIFAAALATLIAFVWSVLHMLGLYS